MALEMTYSVSLTLESEDPQAGTESDGEALDSRRPTALAAQKCPELVHEG